MCKIFLISFKFIISGLISAYRGLRLGLERHEPFLSQKAVSKAGF